VNRYHGLTTVAIQLQSCGLVHVGGISSEPGWFNLRLKKVRD